MEETKFIIILQYRFKKKKEKNNKMKLFYQVIKIRTYF